jgi:hypothetical protein
MLKALNFHSYDQNLLFDVYEVQSQSNLIAYHVLIAYHFQNNDIHSSFF